MFFVLVLFLLAILLLLYLFIIKPIQDEFRDTDLMYAPVVPFGYRVTRESGRWEILFDDMCVAYASDNVIVYKLPDKIIADDVDTSMRVVGAMLWAMKWNLEPPHEAISIDESE
jgi:hypothetical protein